MWINRLLPTKIKELSESRPVLLVTGARQTGKSSLLKKLFPGANYITFDHINQVEAANESSHYFLSQFKDQVILDEVQYVPALFRELKIVVDQDRELYGKWLLTGSQQFSLMKNVGDSLAGRISIIHLETLSALEIRESEVCTKIEDYIWKGGFPEIWANHKIQINDFFESYIRTYIERDLKLIIEVSNLRAFQRLIKVLAIRTGQLINYSDISKDIGISDVTVRKWIHALEASGLIYLLSPYYANLGKRLVKSPKIYFSDHGLLAHLIGIESLDDWHRHIYKGALWENIVMMELIKTNNLRPSNNLFFYRDQNGVEIDFLIEKKGIIYLIEAKAGEKINTKELNFNKVKPLFYNHTVKCLLAQNVIEKEKLVLKDITVLNPLYQTPHLN